MYNEDFKDMQVELPLTIETIMKISARYHPESGKIDYGFSIRKGLFMQHVKVWAVTASQEQIYTRLKILEKVYKIYNSEHINRCAIQDQDNFILPKYFKNDEVEVAKFINEVLDNEWLLEDSFKSLILSGSDFTFQVSKTGYDIIKHPKSTVIFGRSLKKYFNQMQKSAELAGETISKAQFIEWKKEYGSNKALDDNMMRLKPWGTNIGVDYLSREEYRSISNRKYPAYTHNRDEINDLFERYEKDKAQNYDFDSVDRTKSILRATKTRTFGGPHIRDVAQCIARGSTFRFEDLYSLIHQWEHKRVLTENNRYSSYKPKKFELNINSRSHRGILRLAPSVIYLLQKFFPNSIDNLSPELSEIGGPQPIIFEGCQAENLFAYKNDIENEDAFIKFGADQVIIAKGMEFNDMLLYAFFTDLPALLHWRVILSDLEDYSELENISGFLMKIPRIMSQFGNTGDTKSYQVVPSQWNCEGRTFFEQRKYEQAIFCFKRSGNGKGEKLAYAYHLQQLARTSFVTDDDDTIIEANFTKAASAFGECSRLPHAVSCYENINMFREAGELYSESKMFGMPRVVIERLGCGTKQFVTLIQTIEQGTNKISVMRRPIISISTFKILHSHDKFEEAADMLNRSVDDDENTNDATQYLLRLCRINVLKEIFTDFTSLSTMQELNRLQTKAAESLKNYNSN
ncbi:1856_t:CDS:10 [Funneliformis mosseae]|uniref:1856_t:CDS:1 n=1 Tax=Funneliformis mosseae TaxID=27381 RepID=A0A9N9FDU9_FUNMO|nr:1856_t:CDS:10 [Funneliformis mosseae]